MKICGFYFIKFGQEPSSVDRQTSTLLTPSHSLHFLLVNALKRAVCLHLSGVNNPLQKNDDNKNNNDVYQKN